MFITPSNDTLNAFEYVLTVVYFDICLVLTILMLSLCFSSIVDLVTHIFLPRQRATLQIGNVKLNWVLNDILTTVIISVIAAITTILWPAAIFFWMWIARCYKQEQKEQEVIDKLKGLHLT